MLLHFSIEVISFVSHYIIENIQKYTAIVLQESLFL